MHLSRIYFSGIYIYIYIKMNNIVNTAACRKGNPCDILEETFSLHSFISQSPFFCSFSRLLFLLNAENRELFDFQITMEKKKRNIKSNLMNQSPPEILLLLQIHTTNPILISSLLKEASFFVL